MIIIVFISYYNHRLFYVKALIFDYTNIMIMVGFPIPFLIGYLFYAMSMQDLKKGPGSKWVCSIVIFG